jgi:hypothetical protein
MGMLKPLNLLCLEVPDSDFARFLEEIDKFISRYPEILLAIEADLDAHGREKKMWRLLDERWEQRRHCVEIEGAEHWPEIDPDELELKQGRPRMPAPVVFMFMMIRAYAGGAASREFQDLTNESMTVHMMLRHHDMTMPGVSTINENLNAVTNQTRRMIHRKQIQYARAEDLDDFAEMTVDSTAVAANTSWPTDSMIILKLITRIWRIGSDLEDYGTENLQRHWTEQWLKKMKRENFAIVMAEGKGERKKHYRQFLDAARKATEHLEAERQAMEQRVEPRGIKPSRRRQLSGDRRQLRRDLEDAQKMIEVADRRVLEGEQTPTTERVLSICAPHAAFITKGGRDPVIGQRPQVCKSGNGLVGYLEVPVGNAADSGMFIPVLRGWMRTTFVIPDLVSTDDGYTSQENLREAKNLGVGKVSFSGSKGRKLHGKWEWWDEERMRAREERSAVESLIFTLKHNHDFGQLSRRGIEAVRAELLEDALAHNFRRMVELRAEDETEKIPKAA